MNQVEGVVFLYGPRFYYSNYYNKMNQVEVVDGVIHIEVNFKWCFSINFVLQKWKENYDMEFLPTLQLLCYIYARLFPNT